MTIFSKVLLIGAWTALLVVGSNITDQPAFPLEASQERIASAPSTPRPLWPLSSGLPSSTFTTSPKPVSIAMLLSQPASYHQQLVAVRGVVTQPEMHLNDSELAIR
ncbi:MAG: hypothetical protein WAU17_07945, partial [Nitrospirales bacterium]